MKTTQLITMIAMLGLAIAKSDAAPNLVPAEPGKTPNYWCTWAVQNYMHGKGVDDFDPSVLEGPSGAALARVHLNEENLLGENGWMRTFYPQGRSDMYLVLDDGWDVPMKDTKAWYSSFILDEEKFPSFAHLTPAQRLTKLNEAAKEAGWRGIGLWLAAEEARAVIGDATVEEYWTERLQWCREAGIEYWKVDWGRKMGNDSFLAFLTELARKVHPDLYVEHCTQHGPFNPFPRMKPAWFATCQKRTQYADIVRLYDLSPQLSLPCMLERVAGVLEACNGKPTETMGLLNCDDEPTIAAALGVCIGVLRHPMVGLRSGSDYDLFMSGPREQKRRMDETVRAVRWQRIAPAWAVGKEKTVLSSTRLTDSWFFRKGDFWAGIGKEIKQSAPAIVARGLDLPQVTAEGEEPYVIASRHPNGAIALASLGRMSRENGWSQPRAKVVLSVGAASAPIAIIGRHDEVVLEFAGSIESVEHVWAQDLLADRAADIKSRVTIKGNSLTIPGALIDEIGTSAGTEGDVSSPGMVLRLDG